MPEDMSDRMPEDMPDHMPEDMPDRMPEDINVMVGITRSKVIFVCGVHLRFGDAFKISNTQWFIQHTPVSSVGPWISKI